MSDMDTYVKAIRYARCDLIRADAMISLALRAADDKSDLTRISTVISGLISDMDRRLA